MSIYHLLGRMRSWFCPPRRRRRKALGLALIGVCAAGSHGTSRGQDDGGRITISLDADDIEYSETDSSAVLTGNVRLEAKGLSGAVPEVAMTTDRLRIALDAGEVEAASGATFVMPQVEITGEALRYNIRAQEFHGENARCTVRVPLRRRELTVYGRSDTIDVVSDEVELRKASITTCDREEPHYALKVRRTRVKLDTDELSINGGSVSLYGVDVPLVSNFSTKISPQGGQGLMVLPMLGYSQREGVYVPFKKGFTSADDPIRAAADLRLTQRHFLAGSVVAEHSRPGFRAWATLARRLEMQDDISNKLVYDALPELGLEVSREHGESVLAARLMGGGYRDEDVQTGQRAREAAATLQLDWDWLQQREGRRPDLWAGAGVRGSIYGSGDTYRTVHFRVGAASSLWSGARARLELRHHIVGGQTPFEFDDVDLKTEAAASLHTPLWGPWGLGLMGRYDLHRSSLRDYSIDLERKAHCLTWRLRYRKVGSRIGIGVDLTDLIEDANEGPFRRPARPRSVVGAIVAQATQRETRSALPDALSAASAPLESIPSEFQLAEGHRQRAPDAPDAFSRRPPPSLRLAYAGEF